MKHIIVIILLSFLFQFNSNSQSLDKKKTIINYAQWERSISDVNKINLVYYVLKSDILTYRDYDQKQKTVSELPKYRFELFLTSESINKDRRVKIKLTETRIYVDEEEVTYEQFPKGFSAVIETEPTLIYWYETSKDSINLQIKWKTANIEK